MAALLEFAGVSYQVGERQILERIDWRVEPRQHWAVLGPNGAGKTTLLRLACGYLWPNARGEIRRLGKVCCDLRQLRRSIGWVTSTLNARIGRHETALQTVLSGKYAQIGWRPIAGEKPVGDDIDLARHYLQQMGQAHLQQQAFHSLSQGEQQSVLVARARMAKPLLVILDEPCAGMDPGVRERFLATLTEVLASPDAPSVVLVTHHIEEILPEIGHTLVLNSGRVAANGKTTQVINESTMAKIYDMTPPELIKRGSRFWPIWN